ncbi:hypothetical protein JA1_004142 [Spathaspora sp. JA1]|nr:hypothetical protein JA1_004142 [Spathaspora sp. JA1]
MMIASATEVSHGSIFNYTLTPTTSSLAAISETATPVTIHSTSPPTPSSPSPEDELLSELPESTSPPTVVPTLDEILDSTINAQNSDFNLVKFVNYLSSVHGNENLEFVLDVKSYLSLRPPTLAHWQELYSKYVEFEAPSEVNLPCVFKSQLSMGKMPDLTLLIKCKRYIHDEILINLYQEFVKHVKKAFDCQFTSCSPPTVSPRHSIYCGNKNTSVRAAPALTHSQSVYCSSSNKNGPISAARLRHSNSVSGATMFTEQSENLHRHSHKGGYDYYTIPASDCSSTSEDDNSPRGTRNNSASSIGRGSGSISSYKSMIKKFKFRRSSTDEQ